ncbi:hypothetical protein [Bacillus massiliglaciei]|uniref:hypothetical protein n=1 Tax=Bacillus massiliglaciei TaxID=1816693 RepID=UPI0018FEB4B8|nr:hypothetical protein [Bacillus massiliglaciei]
MDQPLFGNCEESKEKKDHKLASYLVGGIASEEQILSGQMEEERTDGKADQ